MPRTTQKKSTHVQQNSPEQETMASRMDTLEKTMTDALEIIDKLQDKIANQNEQISLLRQLINENDTKSVIEAAKHQREISQINNNLTKYAEIRHEKPGHAPFKVGTVEIPMPTFDGDHKSDHPKRFLRSLNTYMTHKNVVMMDEKMVIIENCLRGKAAKWFLMIKEAATDEEKFRQLFLKHFFSENKQWEKFIQCTEAGKQLVTKNFQEHFHHWMDELKYLDSPKLDENQAINLVMKHFPIAIQAFVQTTEKKFLTVWEKLGELENMNENFNNSQTDGQAKSRFSTTTYKDSSNYRNEQPSHRASAYDNEYTGQNTPHYGKYNVKQITVEEQDGEEDEEEQKNWEKGIETEDQSRSTMPLVSEN